MHIYMILFLLAEFRMGQTKLSVVGTTCSNYLCYEGNNCMCDCQGGKSMILLYGGCNYCSVNTCQSQLSSICHAGVKSAVCNENCQSAELIDDGQCHQIQRRNGEEISYTLTCQGELYSGAVGNNCSDLRSFSGDSRYCYSPKNIDLLGMRINCKQGISDGGIVGITLAVVFSFFCICYCIFTDEVQSYMQNCKCSCRPRKGIRRQYDSFTGSKTAETKAPTASEFKGQSA
eukprot:gb/GEZN01012928.1/.p1 GENE.gb/GEZN01012928.1/~~gb/GEZN01012928.1/.p1  ORF type:complete len:231 (-),score=15.31 gb/GEZN01012928.1/:285-977(-)